MFEGGDDRRELDREISESDRFLLIVIFAEMIIVSLKLNR
jgi:hypothetical protein